MDSSERDGLSTERVCFTYLGIVSINVNINRSQGTAYLFLHLPSTPMSLSLPLNPLMRRSLPNPLTSQRSRLQQMRSWWSVDQESLLNLFSSVHTYIYLFEQKATHIFLISNTSLQHRHRQWDEISDQLLRLTRILQS